VQFAFESGFRNMSLDLIYGIPGLTNSMWEAEIEVAANLPVSHISAYHLTVEAGTALENLIRRKKYPNLSERAGVEQFEILMDKLESVGYEHYEISNFAKSSLYSRHNRSYWQNKPYLGIGPSAHSYNLKTREWNTSNLRTYFEGIESGKRVFESEVLSEKDFFNEFIMLGLRTSEGVSLKELERRFPSFKADFDSVAEKYFQRGQMVFSEGSYRLSRSGKFFADAIAADFFQ
ncbi:MAG: coproporphyrinogen III oxidase, partial [Bacteroidales bacterium]|nr:coproporphyrinogen III oxidase [Bacteroidales bacterium]